MSLLFADPDELHAIAGRISRHADAVRRTADRLSAQLGTTRWHGAASRAFHGQAGCAVLSIRRSAGRLDDAADALRRIASNLTDFLADVRRTLQDAGHAVTDVSQLAGDLLTHRSVLGRDLGHVLEDLGDVAGGVGHAAADVVGGALGLVGL